MNIREINETDSLKNIGQIYADSWKAAYKDIISDQYLLNLKGEQWIPFLESKDNKSFVMVDRESYLGTAAVTSGENKESFEMVSLYILPECFGRGYGKLLLDFVIDRLRSDGCKEVYLWVLDENVKAQKFYKNNMFEKGKEDMRVTVGDRELLAVKYSRSMNSY